MLTAAHAMQTRVETVSPEMSLVELERKLLMLGLGGFPVIEHGKLVGIVSRSDVVRLLAVERATGEQLSDFYRSFDSPTRTGGPSEERAAVGARVGERAARLKVRDAMIGRVISIERDLPLCEVARLLLDGHIHRLPVVEDGRLVGIVTTLDLVRLVAEGRIVEARSDEATSALLGAGVAPGGKIDERRTTLEKRLGRLIARTRAIEEDLRRKRHPDSGERAVERENDEVLERLQESERRHIAQIRRAIERLEAGKHDACELCGEPVGQARQAALPEATRCLACS